MENHEWRPPSSKARPGKLVCANPAAIGKRLRRDELARKITSPLDTLNVGHGRFRLAQEPMDTVAHGSSPERQSPGGRYVSGLFKYTSSRRSFSFVAINPVAFFSPVALLTNMRLPAPLGSITSTSAYVDMDSPEPHTNS